MSVSCTISRARGAASVCGTQIRMVSSPSGVSLSRWCMVLSLFLPQRKKCMSLGIGLRSTALGPGIFHSSSRHWRPLLGLATRHVLLQLQRRLRASGVSVRLQLSVRSSRSHPRRSLESLVHTIHLHDSPSAERTVAVFVRSSGRAGWILSYSSTIEQH